MTVVACEGLAYGLALACRRSEPAVVIFGAAGWSSEATVFAPGRFASIMLAPAESRSHCEATGVLDGRVQAYGGHMCVPRVRGAHEATVSTSALPQAAPRRLKAKAEIYENLALPRWEAARRTYVATVPGYAGSDF